MKTIQNEISVKQIKSALGDSAWQHGTVVFTNSKGESYMFPARLSAKFNEQYLTVEVIGDGTYTHNIEE